MCAETVDKEKGIKMSFRIKTTLFNWSKKRAEAAEKGGRVVGEGGRSSSHRMSLVHCRDPAAVPLFTSVSRG